MAWNGNSRRWWSWAVVNLDTGGRCSHVLPRTDRLGLDRSLVIGLEAYSVGVLFWRLEQVALPPDSGCQLMSSQPKHQCLVHR